MISFNSIYIVLSSYDKQCNLSNYLICIFINFNENIKWQKNLAKAINQLMSDPDCHCDTFFEPVISYGKSIDDLGRYENNLICIFMNIKMSKIEEKRGKNCINFKVLDML